MDALQVLYELWREDPGMQQEAKNVFQELKLKRDLAYLFSLFLHLVYLYYSIS